MDDEMESDEFHSYRRASGISIRTLASITSEDMASIRRARLTRQFSGFTTPQSISEAFFGFTLPQVREKEPEKEEPEEVFRWDTRDLIYNWSENTTFHGVKFITEKSDIKLRRIIWLIALLGCTILLVYQISLRVIEYWKSPVNVNVKVNYNSSIIFPTVTICNQNQYRLSKAYDNNLTEVLKTVGPYGNKNINGSVLRGELEPWALNLSTQDIYEKTAHNIKDMLLNCKWYGQNCDWRNFTKIYTDQGVCYGFNRLKNDSNLLVTDAGIGKGLSVTLNVQQYDYMENFHDSAGIRFLLHSEDTVPMVTALGQAAATGTHTYIGVEANKFVYQTPPYGNCTKDMHLRNFPVYNKINCKMECRTEFALKKCTCREFYMPNIGGKAPICSLYQHYSCINDAMNVFIRNDSSCDCLIACTKTVFDSTLSFASTSNLAVEGIRRNRTIFKRIESEYQKSNDIKAFLSHKAKFRDFEIAENFLNSTDEYFKVVWRSVPLVLSGGRMLLQELNNIIRMADQKLMMLRNQSALVKMNLYRGFQSADERTFEMVAHRFYEFSTFYKQKMKILTDPDITDQSFRRAVYHEAKLETKIRHDSCKYANFKVSEIAGRYKNAEPYFDDLRGVNSSHAFYMILPKQLIKKRLLMVIEKYPIWNGTLERTKQLNTTYVQMQDYLERAFKGERIPYPSVKKLVKIYIGHVKAWLAFRGEFMTDIFKYPINVLRFEEDYMIGKSIELKTLRRDVLAYNRPQILSINSTFTSATSNNGVKKLNRLVEEYKRSLRTDRLTFRKSVFCRKFLKLSRTIENESHKLKNIKMKLVNHYGVWERWWRELNVKASLIWEKIFNDTDSYDFYELLDLKWTRNNLSVVLHNITNFYRNKSAAHNLVSQLEQTFQKYQVAVNNLQENAFNYNASIQISSGLIKNNIVALDIFFKELSIKAIEQQIGYPLSSLLSDIGGLLGLCIGASLLSIVEIFDLLGQLIFQTHYKIRMTHKEKRSKLSKKKQDRKGKEYISCLDRGGYNGQTQDQKGASFSAV